MKNAHQTSYIHNLHSNNRDGKPYSTQRRHNIPEHLRHEYLNPPIPHQDTAVRPLAQGLNESVGAIPRARIEMASKPLDAKLLRDKLLKVKQELDQNEKLKEKIEEPEKLGRILNDRLAPMADTDEDTQQILDNHVSRVFSPHRTPGTVSPSQLHRPANRCNQLSASLTDFSKFHTWFLEDFFWKGHQFSISSIKI